MARSLTFDEAISLLQNVPKVVRPEVKAAMKTCVLLGEGQAKINCGYIVGKDGPAPASIPGSVYYPCPYPKPPHQHGRLSRGNHGWVEENGDQIVGFVGNDVKEYNLYVHEGTSKMAGRPFLQAAARMQKDNSLSVLGAGVVKGLKKVKP